jgi:predicted TIM-barrel fold metal-dependent hydrolase
MPDVEGSLREIEYAFDTLKADGISMLTSYGNKWLGDETLAPVFDELNRRKAIIYTHPIQAACCPNLVKGVTPQTLEYVADTTRTIMSLIVSNTTTRCPDIKFIFSHAGGALISIAARWLGDAANGDNLTKPAEANSRLGQLKRFYYDTAQSPSPVLLQSLKMLVPASQIVYGTDWPFANPAAQALHCRRAVSARKNFGEYFETMPRGCCRSTRRFVLVRSIHIRSLNEYVDSIQHRRCLDVTGVIGFPAGICSGELAHRLDGHMALAS